jgi:large subunit ribosomal protein L24
LAIALIVALVAALVGPLVIDWTTYRTLFEREASHLVGVHVRVTGAIDARLLPSPQLTLHGIEIGDGAEKVRARALGIEFALGPLMRGEWQADQMHLEGPQVTLGLDAAGHVRAPTLAVAFNPDALAIERLSIEDGKITLADAANGASVTLDKFWFNGEARSLLGPFNGEGAATVGGELYPYRVTAGRYGDDGALKLRVNVDPVAHPLSVQADGTLALAGGAPRFDGTLSLTRPVGISSRQAAQVTEPWRVNGKIKVTAQSALMENVEFQYGSEEQGLKLNGVADFQFGKRPRFNGVLSGRQIDLDRALLSGDGQRPAPAAALRQLIEWGGAAFRPKIPIQIGVGIDQINLGGSTVQNLRGDISTDAGGWNLDRFEFRAPGFTQVKLSGHLAVRKDTVAFTGPAEIDANDPKVLAAWLEGRGDTAQGDLRPLSLRGDVTLGNDRIAVEKLKAEFDRKTIAGRLDYAFASGKQPAKLDAELNAPQLDLDAALGFGKAMLNGSKLERPHDMNIAADIGRATIAGFTARDASVRLKVDGEGLQIDKLSVADLGGAAFSASGRIVTGKPSPQGTVRVDLDAPDLTPVMAVLGRFAPETVQALGQGVSAMSPAKLHGQFTLDGAAPAAQGKIDVDGNLGKVRVALNGQGRVDPATYAVGDVKLNGRLDADDGKLLVTMLGLDRYVAAGAGPGALTLDASGPARGELRVNGRLTAAGLEAGANGTAKLFADSPAAKLQVKVARADVSPLRGPGGERAALPVSYTGRVALAGKALTLSDINATVGGGNMRGKLAVTLDAPRQVQGDIDADNVDAASLIAAAVGMPKAQASAGGNANANANAGANANGAWAWSDEPFAGAPYGAMTGQVAFKARRIDLLPRLSAREFKTTVRFDKDGLSLDDMSGVVSGGKFAGQFALQQSGEGVKAHAKVSLTGVDAANLIGGGARPPVAGSLTLSGELDGTGLSPVALIGSLQGTGKLFMTEGQFSGLDPRAFTAATRAVDQGMVIDSKRIADVVNKGLESGQLSVKRAEGDIAVSAGQVRLNNVRANGGDADLILGGNLDLTDGLLDARLVLSGPGEAAGARPDIYIALKGQIGAPQRSVDVSALTGWLTLRSVENQAKRLQAIERSPAKPDAPAPQPPAPQSADTQTPRAAAPQPPARHKKASPSSRAPALPAPIDIRPLPEPSGVGRPQTSVGR